MSGIRLPDCSKLAVNWKNGKDVVIFRHDIIVKFFWRCLIPLVKFNYLSKFNVNIIIRSGVMTISFYKGLTRHSEIGNNPIWVLPNIWRLGWVNVSSKILLNAAKCQGCCFYRFWVNKGKPTGWEGGRKITSSPRTKIRIKRSCYKLPIVLKLLLIHLLLKNYSDLTWVIYWKRIL